MDMSRNYTYPSGPTRSIPRVENDPSSSVDGEVGAMFSDDAPPPYFDPGNGGTGCPSNYGTRYSLPETSIHRPDRQEARASRRQPSQYLMTQAGRLCEYLRPTSSTSRTSLHLPSSLSPRTSASNRPSGVSASRCPCPSASCHSKRNTSNDVGLWNPASINHTYLTTLPMVHNDGRSHGSLRNTVTPSNSRPTPTNVSGISDTRVADAPAIVVACIPREAPDPDTDSHPDYDVFLDLSSASGMTDPRAASLPGSSTPVKSNATLSPRPHLRGGARSPAYPHAYEKGKGDKARVKWLIWKTAGGRGKAPKKPQLDARADHYNLRGHTHDFWTSKGDIRGHKGGVLWWWKPKGKAPANAGAQAEQGPPEDGPQAHPHMLNDHGDGGDDWQDEGNIVPGFHNGRWPVGEAEAVNPAPVGRQRQMRAGNDQSTTRRSHRVPVALNSTT